ncbi:MAG: hypothetical protein A3A10_00595 [Candidatus Tagabacteria bacterium RIFCSPLOWO2_01_FULL_42_9]|uniref:UPF0102 protein A3A10_00595 n=1 Tax=Candidatus Tagabacteria bacterium RIFCSPLOWO2_01_FULL_42_9 TaxID=1802296 RepID=A0A1G2LYD9_9BACT|nr:MAG: hypothetical protein A3A10_00595 [Candidatus Tagabacteria bacterium RIFCSPLOWO2_01_FULL_42_9]
MPETGKQIIGRLGEDIAVKHFVKHSFKVLDRNYRKKWGEIDIVAEKDNILHFIEVKAVSCETAYPEENVHFWKRQRLSRTIQTYLAEKDVSYETEWQMDVAAVFINHETKTAKIRIMENVLL